MRIRNILHIVSAKTWGGGESAALSMCKAAHEQGYGVVAVLDSSFSHYANRFTPFAEVVCLSMHRKSFFCTVLQLRRILREKCIDVIHTHTGKNLPLAVLASYKLKTKVVAFRHNVLPNKTDLYHRILYRHIDAFLCVSSAVYDTQVATVEEKLRPRFFCVYLGIDASSPAFTKTIARPHRQDALILGFAGRIDPNKGLSVLLEALASLSDTRIRLLIAGDDSTAHAKELHRYCEINGLSQCVTWIGFQKEMQSFYSAIDVLILPTLIPEAFGLVLCEAMAAGCPVIATNIGAPCELVEHGRNDFLIPPGDSLALADGIKQFADHTQNIQPMGENGRALILQRFTMEQWKKRMNEVYHALFS